MSEHTLSFVPNGRDANAHLTEWTLAMAVRQEAVMSSEQAAHLLECAYCQDALAIRQQEHAVARTKPMPASLRALIAAPATVTETAPSAAPVVALRSTARRAAPVRRSWVTAGTSLLAAGVIAILGVSLRNVEATAPGPLSKGQGVVVLASVMRNNTLLLRDQPLSELHDLRSGDHMRLWVNGAETDSHVVLETLEDEGWVPLFNGPLPADHGLPSGLLLDGNPTHLQLRVCDSEDSHCSTQRFDF